MFLNVANINAIVVRHEHEVYCQHVAWQMTNEDKIPIHSQLTESKLNSQATNAQHMFHFKTDDVLYMYFLCIPTVLILHCVTGKT